MSTDQIIQTVSTATTPDLGITTDTAREWKNQIIESDRDDAPALTTYDLLAARALNGRAW